MATKQTRTPATPRTAASPKPGNASPAKATKPAAAKKTASAAAPASGAGTAAKQTVKGPASYFPSIEKTYGQPVDHWFRILDTLEGRKHMEQVNALKAEHGLGHGHANALVAFHAKRGV